MRGPPDYKISAVDTDDDDAVEDLTFLHRLTFGPDAAVPKWAEGDRWAWLAHNGVDRPVAFLTMIPSIYKNGLYFERVGVAPKHRGNGLQMRLMRHMVRRARRLPKYAFIVSDTTGNVHSANCFVRSGWLMFIPESPWAFESTLYWYLDL
jgi:GNAT superfamily N-acetyltransferase